MRLAFRWLCLPAALLGGLALTTGPAEAQKKADPPALLILVKDGAKLFKTETVSKANDTVERIKRDYNKTLAIETVKSLPDGSTSNEAVTAFAKDRYRELKVRGIY